MKQSKLHMHEDYYTVHIPCEKCNYKLIKKKSIWYNNQDCYWCEVCEEIRCFPFFRDVLGNCIELDKLHHDCALDCMANGTWSFWCPVDTEEYKAIPEHSIWNDKFESHKKSCGACRAKKEIEIKENLTELVGIFVPE